MTIFSELRRRNILRISGAYALASWLLLHLAGLLEGAMSLPPWFDSLVLATLVIGFPFALIIAWAFINPRKNSLARAGAWLDILLLIGLVAFAATQILPEFLSA